MVKLASTEVDKLIGARIQQKRKEVGLSAAELSEKIGIAQQQLSRYERGENKINVSHLVEIASYLNTEIGWFFIDCMSDQTQNGKRKFIPVAEDDIRNRLAFHLDNLSADKKRGLLVFLETIQ
ncbi:helix-turn-helix transcriptional regulator [Pasteurella atlantica]|uniref:Helix-turn-helix transcriptional regulator n=2 Tax=Pasteurellaceae TaxID=712 RepID=A0ACC6HJT2_9PAST|nr:helix-turn-helix transcriptional regulator [Pasteurella atlantica]MDP8051125.1 helix-turn-helix transcriptional regulator [Pasteurella atlantica]MDP8104421.1 helix-turn-helix transcriptional regulator [Pasteurella atlantica]MDP8147781.1 helix-turn-helix transcriptional regulator [Pasteurella atlantica]